MPIYQYHHTTAATFMTGALISFAFVVMFIIEIIKNKHEDGSKYYKDLEISAAIFGACSLMIIIENKRNQNN